jgi:hypothetical protein
VCVEWLKRKHPKTLRIEKSKREKKKKKIEDVS